MPSGFYMAAMMHLYGVGTQKDAKMGIELLNRAAEMGSIEALEKLGELYRFGEFGLEKSEEKAVMFQKAASSLKEREVTQPLETSPLWSKRVPANKGIYPKLLETKTKAGISIMSNKLYHLVQKSVWQAAKQSGNEYYPFTYQQDGFIHLTKDPQFLLGVGNHFYQAVPGDYLLLVIDAEKLKAKVIFELAAPVGSISPTGLLTAAPGVSHDSEGSQGSATATVETSGSEPAVLFPHLYGTVDYEAVMQELTVVRDEAGRFLRIEGLESI
jgi:uncharacterized protein (DUF952 family)